VRGYEQIGEQAHLNVVSACFQWRFPEHVILIYHEAFECCNNFHVEGNCIFWDCTDPLQVFGVAIGGDLGPFLYALRGRFDGPVIHKLCYYKPYNMNALLDFIR